ncbi:PilZ domain-containing protein [bacterium]|nr:PilZ domain-containing protein [bacterium]
MAERRKLDRKNFIYDIEVLDRNQSNEGEDGFFVLGDLADITVEGVMLVSDEPIAEKTLFQLRVVLPEEIEATSEIDFDAESIICKKTIHESIYTTGFRITNLDDSNRSIISRLISEYAV